MELHAGVEGGKVKPNNMNELLKNINNTLEIQLKRQNEIMQQMLDIMPRPAGKFKNILETAVLIASVFGILNLIDIIIKWVIGG
jgi:DNA-directed RNA polymerase subunit F